VSAHLLPYTHNLTTILEKYGFPLSGVVDYERIKPELELHGSHFAEWIRGGFHGEMRYLERRLPERLDPKKWFPNLQAAICVARPYRAKAQGAQGFRWARYLAGADYHLTMKRDFERALAEWASIWDGKARPNWKVGVDTAPIMERSWAAWSGLGWIGKNGCLIHPQFGSYLFLAVAFVDIRFEQGPRKVPNYCGPCEKCLIGCPTGAFIKPGLLDSKKCIAYWTLEERGDRELDEPSQRALGTWVAGCDLCQEVCPFNRKAEKKDDAPIEDLSPIFLAPDTGYAERVKGRALDRVKPEMMQRNVLRASKNLEKKSQLEPVSPTGIEE
jgi:epoxyqueuosine reductase